MPTLQDIFAMFAPPAEGGGAAPKAKAPPLPPVLVPEGQPLPKPEDTDTYINTQGRVVRVPKGTSLRGPSAWTKIERPLPNAASSLPAAPSPFDLGAMPMLPTDFKAPQLTTPNYDALIAANPDAFRKSTPIDFSQMPKAKTPLPYDILPEATALADKMKAASAPKDTRLSEGEWLKQANNDALAATLRGMAGADGFGEMLALGAAGMLDSYGNAEDTRKKESDAFDQLVREHELQKLEIDSGLLQTKAALAEAKSEAEYRDILSDQNVWLLQQQENNRVGEEIRALAMQKLELGLRGEDARVSTQHQQAGLDFDVTQANAANAYKNNLAKMGDFQITGNGTAIRRFIGADGNMKVEEVPFGKAGTLKEKLELAALAGGAQGEAMKNDYVYGRMAQIAPEMLPQAMLMDLITSGNIRKIFPREVNDGLFGLGASKDILSTAQEKAAEIIQSQTQAMGWTPEQVQMQYTSLLAEMLKPLLTPEIIMQASPDYAQKYFRGQ